MLVYIGFTDRFVACVAEVEAVLHLCVLPVEHSLLCSSVRFTLVHLCVYLCVKHVEQSSVLCLLFVLDDGVVRAAGARLLLGSGWAGGLVCLLGSGMAGDHVCLHRLF